MVKTKPKKISNLRRYYLPDRIVFVTTSTKNKVPVFQSAENAQILTDLLYELRRENELKLYAFVVMPDHLHFIFLPVPPENLSTILHKLKRRSSREIHKRTRIKGMLWESRFYDRIIRNEEEFAKAIDYIHWNPVKAGLSETPEDYLFSSAFSKWETDLQGYLAEPLK